MAGRQRVRTDRQVAPDVLDALVGWLPCSEFAVALHEHADAVVVVSSGAAPEAVAVVVHDGPTLAPSGTTASCAGAPDAAAALGTALRRVAATDGVLEIGGCEPLASEVATVVAAARGATAVSAMAQRLLVTTAVQRPAEVAGRGSHAADADMATVAGWLDEFMVEALGRQRQGPDHWLEVLGEAEQTATWTWVVDGAPVSMLGVRQSTPVSSRIGPVYTPPDLRGNGYASALTAQVASEVLAAGADRAALMTDATNPTSNELYARIGFRDVGAHGTWRVTV